MKKNTLSTPGSGGIEASGESRQILDSSQTTSMKQECLTVRPNQIGNHLNSDRQLQNVYVQHDYPNCLVCCVCTILSKYIDFVFDTDAIFKDNFNTPLNFFDDVDKLFNICKKISGVNFEYKKSYIYKRNYYSSKRKDDLFLDLFKKLNNTSSENTELVLGLTGGEFSKGHAVLFDDNNNSIINSCDVGIKVINPFNPIDESRVFYSKDLIFRRLKIAMFLDLII